MASLGKNILYNSGYKAFQILVPLIVTPYLSRTLGADGVGFYSYVNTIAAYFVLFAMMGIGTHGVRTIAAVDPSNRNALSRRFWELYSCQLITGGLAFVAYILYVVFFSGDIVAAALWAPYIFSVLIDMSWFLFGQGEFRVPTIRNFILQVLSTLGVFILVKTSEDVYIYICITSATALLAQLCLLPYVVRRVSAVCPRKTEFISCFKSCALLFLPVVAATVYTSIDKIMLGSMCGMAENGYYTYADKINSVLLSVLSAFCAVMLPKMTSLYSQGKNKEASELISLSMWGVQALAWGICFGLMGIASELVPVFLGETFTPCVAPLLVLCARVPIVAAEYVLGNQYILPLGMDKQYTKAVMLGALVDVALNCLLIPRFGSIGAALGTVAAELTVLLYEVILTRKQLPLLRYAKAAIPFILIGLLLLLFLKILSAACLAAWGLGVSVLVVEIMAGVLFYSLGVFVYARLSKDRHALRLLEVVAPKLLPIVGHEKNR